jgi:hypothetical protein
MRSSATALALGTFLLLAVGGCGRSDPAHAGSQAPYEAKIAAISPGMTKSEIILKIGQPSGYAGSALVYQDSNAKSMLLVQPSDHTGERAIIPCGWMLVRVPAARRLTPLNMPVYEVEQLGGEADKYKSKDFVWPTEFKVSSGGSLKVSGVCLQISDKFLKL